MELCYALIRTCLVARAHAHSAKVIILRMSQRRVHCASALPGIALIRCSLETMAVLRVAFCILLSLVVVGAITQPDSYYAMGSIMLPYAGIVEPYESWVDTKTGLSRIDYYNGTAQMVATDFAAFSRAFIFFRQCEDLLVRQLPKRAVWAAVQDCSCDKKQFLLQQGNVFHSEGRG